MIHWCYIESTFIRINTSGKQQFNLRTGAQTLFGLEKWMLFSFVTSGWQQRARFMKSTQTFWISFKRGGKNSSLCCDCCLSVKDTGIVVIPVSISDPPVSVCKHLTYNPEFVHVTVLLCLLYISSTSHCLLQLLMLSPNSSKFSFRVWNVNEK